VCASRSSAWSASSPPAAGSSSPRAWSAPLDAASGAWRHADSRPAAPAGSGQPAGRWRRSWRGRDRRASRGDPGRTWATARYRAINRSKATTRKRAKEPVFLPADGAVLVVDVLDDPGSRRRRRASLEHVAAVTAAWFRESAGSRSAARGHSRPSPTGRSELALRLGAPLPGSFPPPRTWEAAMRALVAATSTMGPRPLASVGSAGLGRRRGRRAPPPRPASSDSSSPLTGTSRSEALTPTSAAWIGK
jgi:hypothetical protein